MSEYRFKLIKDFLESIIGEIEVEEEDNKFYVYGCLQMSTGNLYEPPTCKLELEGVGDTEEDAVLDALSQVVEMLKTDIREEIAFTTLQNSHIADI